MDQLSEQEGRSPLPAMIQGADVSKGVPAGVDLSGPVLLDRDEPRLSGKRFAEHFFDAECHEVVSNVPPPVAQETHMDSSRYLLHPPDISSQAALTRITPSPSY